MHKMLNCKVIKIECRTDQRGKLSFIQNSNLPFDIKRVFWIIPKDKRGKHAHYKTKQCMICIKGWCNVKLDNGKEKEEITLKDNDKGLIIEPNFWHSISGFSEDCIILVLASEEYDEKDYIREYNKFIEVYSS